MYSTSLNQRIGSLIEKDTLSLPKDTVVSDAVYAMKEKGVSSLLVTSVILRLLKRYLMRRNRLQ